MFNLFKNKEIDYKKISIFCEWFIKNEQRFINNYKQININKHLSMTDLDEIEIQLKKVYIDGYKGNVEFDFGPDFNNQNIMCLNLYHFNKKYLIKVTNEIASILNDKLKNKWKVNCDR